jgi:hypothetical protein
VSDVVVYHIRIIMFDWKIETPWMTRSDHSDIESIAAFEQKQD